MIKDKLKRGELSQIMFRCGVSYNHLSNFQTSKQNSFLHFGVVLVGGRVDKKNHLWDQIPIPPAMKETPQIRKVFPNSWVETLNTCWKHDTPTTRTSYIYICFFHVCVCDMCACLLSSHFQLGLPSGFSLWKSSLQRKTTLPVMGSDSWRCSWPTCQHKREPPQNSEKTPLRKNRESIPTSSGMALLTVFHWLPGTYKTCTGG